jgi:hypothetical protein
MQFVLEIVVSLITSGLAASAVLFLGKNIISERLKSAIRYEYDQKLESHKSQLMAQSHVEIERLKFELQKSASDHQIRFSKYHEKQAYVVAKAYRLLVEVKRAAHSFASLIEWNDEPEKKEKYRKTLIASVRFTQFVEYNRIYLTEEVCVRLEGLVREINLHVVDFGVYLEFRDSELPREERQTKLAAWKRVSEYLDKSAPDRLRELERELRELIG